MNRSSTAFSASLIGRLVAASALAACCALPLSALAADAAAPKAHAAEAAPAQDGGNLVDQAFKSADSNHDAVLSKQEAAAFPEIASRFADYDKNGDGILSPDEFQVAAKPKPAK